MEGVYRFLFMQIIVNSNEDIMADYKTTSDGTKDT
jgi:hypothetical protein